MCSVTNSREPKKYFGQNEDDAISVVCVCVCVCVYVLLLWIPELRRGAFFFCLSEAVAAAADSVPSQKRNRWREREREDARKR